MPPVNTFAGAGLARAGDRRRDEAWVAAALSDPATRVVLAGADGVAVRDGHALLLPTGDLHPASLSDGAVLLGADAEGAILAVDADRLPAGRLAALLGAGGLVGLRDVAGELPQRDGGLLAYAAALLGWHRAHAFCGICGTATTSGEAGHVRVCPGCGAHHHPRTDPVVIMLVADEERCLLGRQPSWPAGRYSALAGFVEPGESLEEAVAREVHEEAGVEVAEVVYSSSQPWPFPFSLMLGFRARPTGGEAAPVDGELEDVRWFTRAQLREDVARGGVNVPPRVAIARRLIDQWLEEGEGG